MGSFKSFALSDQLVQALKKLGYVSPTPIQEDVIPKVLRGESLIAKAETGSGKTHAFLVPLIDKIDLEAGLQVIILSPTRELARQTYDFARQIAPTFPKLKVTLATGGREIEILTRTNTPHILITTPGRLVKLAENSSVNIYRVSTIVLDEADMLVDAGFLPIIDQYITKVEKPRILAFSATFPKSLEPFIKKFINPDFIVDQSEGNVAPLRVSHHLVDIHFKPIVEQVASFIDARQPYLMMVFASKVTLVKEIYEHLLQKGYKVGVIHGDLTPRQRNGMIKRIRANEFPIIVASDMAARGLDIDGVSDILSVDLPQQIEFYMHRAGRSGRYQDKGDSFLFFSHDASKELDKLSAFKLSFDYFSLKNGELKKEKPRVARRFNKIEEVALNRDIKKAIRITKSDEVKPGYKKKVKQAVAKVKARHRRLAIKGKVREQLKSVYRNKNKETGHE
jgi:ATP-dependent RNA helicase CshB